MHATMENPSDTIGPAETARRLHLTVAKLRQMRLDGTGPKFTKTGPKDRPSYRYHVEDVTVWAAARYAARKLHSDRSGTGGRSGPGPADRDQLTGIDAIGSLLYRFPGYQPPTEADLAA